MKLNIINVLFIVISGVICTSCTKPKITDINHIVHMGQSLGAGEQSLPIVSNEVSKFGNYKFLMGTHTWEYNFLKEPSERSDSNFQFIPLNANRRGIEGETIANGLCDHLSDTYRTKGKFLFSYAGQGGRYLRELNKEHDDAKDERAKHRKSKGGYYKTSIDDIIRAKKRCDSLGLSYSVMAITWMQGEANGSGKLNRWDEPYERSLFLKAYEKDLVQLKRDYESDISKILKKKVDVPFFSYQTTGTMAGTAQINACDNEQNMYMVGPTYMLPSAQNSIYNFKSKTHHGDGIHLSADGERWLGEQFGKVIRRVVIEGEDWQPLRPLESYFGESKKEVFVKFHVPRPPIILDTLFLPKQETNYGFQVYDLNGQYYKINEVLVVGTDLLKIVLEDDIKSKPFIRYGLNSKIGDVSKPIKNITEGGVNSHGHKIIRFEYEGDILNEFKSVIKEGAFYLRNKESVKTNKAEIIVRNVMLNEHGNTILEGEVNDLKNGINFRIGQKCSFFRRYAYGNLRDSDNEKSTYKFKDPSYGKRQNENYPLNNWCISFQDLEIK